MNSVVKDILAFAEETDNGIWDYSDLEKVLIDAGAAENYQDVKEIILEADKMEVFPRTIKTYLQTNKDAHGNLSSELVDLGLKYSIT